MSAESSKNHQEQSAVASKLILREKVFVAQESLLTTCFQSKHYQTLQHALFAIVLCIFLSNYQTDDDFEAFKGKIASILPKNTDLLKSAFANYEIGIFTWLKMMAITLALFPLVRLWLHYFRTMFGYPFVGIYLLYLTVFISTTYDVLFQRPILGSATAMAVSLEQVRLVAKMHSFVREIVRDVNHKAPPSFANYLYFLFAPTLVYRHSYPRTPSIRWHAVVGYFGHFLLCILIGYLSFDCFIFPEFSDDVYSKPKLATGKQMIRTWMRCCIPSTVVYMAAFYGFFQAWLNGWAELLRFGDRAFYRNWWTSTWYSDYFRKWNIVVHDWLYTYVYKDCCDLFKIGSGLASFLAFIASAIFHEFVMTATLRFCLPLMSYCLLGIPLIRNLANFHNNRYANLYIWVSIFTSVGGMFFLYILEAAAYRVCPSDGNKLMVSINLHSLACFQR